LLSNAVPASVAGLVGLAAYSIFAFFCRNKAEGNEVHPYLAFLPIVRFVRFFISKNDAPTFQRQRAKRRLPYPALKKRLSNYQLMALRVFPLRKDGEGGDFGG
jgi:hypothetical protein